MTRYGLELVTPPVSEPVSLADMKQHARISREDEDTTISAFVTAARQYSETFLRRQLMPATWRMSLDCFPAEMRLPLPPLQSVTSITFVDGNGTTQTVASDTYYVDSTTEPGRIVPVGCWPTARNQPGAVKVTFVAGYDTVPATVTTAIKMLAAHYYEHREAVNEGGLTEVPMAVESLLMSEQWGTL
ncbi:head-tail connector protein [Anatilimnocola floriformis]|uniref:head-tail connector protein n=1 Tax=Anatilimnocola floriformis TaxID=2948575 RepID=UPI0020C28564|nr:head-tail connector protein [Anatilimnocola floriformis]